MAEDMYTYLLERYCAGTLTDKALDAAVKKAWITADEAAAIRAERDRRLQEGDDALIRELEDDSSTQVAASSPQEPQQ